MFKKTLISLLSFSLFLPLASLGLAEKQVVLEEDTRIPVLLTKSISSSNAAVGQPVQAEIAKDIVVDNYVVIKKGTPVKGSVSSIEGAKRMGKGGSISIQFNSVRSVDDQKVSLRSAAGRSGNDKTGKTVAMVVLFGLPGLLVKGREAGIVKGTKIDAFVDEDTNIKSSIEPSEEVTAETTTTEK